MPSHYFKGSGAGYACLNKSGDGIWIDEYLMMAGPSLRTYLADKYSKIYKSTFDKEESKTRKANRARFEANSFLRAYVSDLVENEFAAIHVELNPSKLLVTTTEKYFNVDLK